VPHAMAQFALKTAQIISWGLSLPWKSYFVTVSVPDYGMCSVSTVKATSFSIILFCCFSFWLDLTLEQSRNISESLN
jgi:hypothetical protein